MVFRLLLLSLVGFPFWVHPAWAQQVMPRLLRQIAEKPGLNLKVAHMSHDGQGRLWMASDDGVVCFDGRQFRVYHDPNVGKGDYYYLVFTTPDGRVWPKMGRGHTLSYVDPGQQRMVRLPDSTRLVRDYLAKFGCHYLFADGQGNLWIGLKKRGLLRFNPRTLAVDHLVDQPLDVRGITQDQRGVIYFTTVEQGLFAYAPRTGRLTNYQHNQRDTTSLGSNATYGVTARPDGTILIGLVNEVDVLTPTTGKVQRVPLNSVRSNNPRTTDYIYDFQHDTRGNAYFSTSVATFCYTRRGVLQRMVFGSPTDYIDGLYVSPANRLWVSAAHTLYEYDLNQVREVPSLIFLNVQVNGTQVAGNTATRRFTYDPVGHPTLTVQENDLFNLRFALSARRRSLTIRHKLQSHDPEWVVHENVEGAASYQLPGGTYTFVVNRGHPAGGWDAAVSTLTISVQPPFWKTAWFLALVLSGLGSIGFWTGQSWARRRRLRRELARREVESATLREMDTLKSGFFANVTHEFRTPLTIILNATEQLAGTSLTTPQHKQTDTIQRHAHQLLRLITETLDMARLDAGKLEYCAHLGDPVRFMEQLVAQFGGLASQYGIDLIWTADAQTENSSGESGEVLYRFDSDKWEKITYNLLSNALKFTPKGGQVRVTGHITGQQRFVLRVADTGIGIPADQLGRIFERFHQVDASSTRVYSGTGIGLALVKELTDWLGGTVAVDSGVGRGSVFTVELPLTPPVSDNPDAVNPPRNGVPVHTPVPVLPYLRPAAAMPDHAQPAGFAADADDTGKPLVLVVEDNADLRAQVVDYLSVQYRVVTASTGRQGLERAVAEVPDLIISDVMMPEMDGYELVERLKADECTSHVPVILLTARSSPDSRMKGLQVGADDYLGKPFSLAELALRIGNGLRTRQSWQKRFMVQPLLSTTTPPPPVEPMLGREEKFLNRLRGAILDHIDTETLDVDWLAGQAGMSRTQLHRKLTALTTLSPNRFIHRVRVERAAELLQVGELNVAQVAYQVGYSSQSYFAKVFQEHYGYPPARLKM